MALAMLRAATSNRIYRTVKFPLEIRPEEVKAIPKNGVLELTLPKAEVVKKVHVEVKSSWK